MIILKALLLIFVFAIFVAAFFVFTVISNIRSLLNLRKKTSAGNGASSRNNSHDHGSTHSSGGSANVYSASPKRKGKIIPEDEGEYIDFEEIK